MPAAFLWDGPTSEAICPLVMDHLLEKPSPAWSAKRVAGRPKKQPERRGLAGREATFRLVWNQAESLREVAEQFGEPKRLIMQWAATLRRRGVPLKKFRPGRAAGQPLPGNLKKPPVYVPEAYTFDELNDKLRLGLSLSEPEEERMSEHLRQRAAECRRLREAGTPLLTSGGGR